MSNVSKIMLKILIVLGFIFIVAVYLGPFAVCGLYAIKNDKEVIRKGPLEFPDEPTLMSFVKAAEKIDYFRILINTVTITVFGVGGSILLSSLASYGMARGTGKHFNLLYIIFLSGILLPYQALLVPIFIMGYKMGFMNNMIGVIFFYIAGGLPIGIFILVRFMKTIPLEIEQASIVDGCNVLQTFFLIVFPMLKPAVISLAVLRSLGIWNDYLLVRLFLTRKELQTFTVRISMFFEQYRYNLNYAFAGIILVSIPMIIFFVASQKYLVKGITAGALKG